MIIGFDRGLFGVTGTIGFRSWSVIVCRRKFVEYKVQERCRKEQKKKLFSGLL
jgi:hypothetical protein